MIKAGWLTFIAALLAVWAASAQDVSDLFAGLEAHYRENPPSFPTAFDALEAKAVSQQYPGGVRIHYVPEGVAVIDSSLGGYFGPTGVFCPAHGSGETAETATRILKARIGGATDHWLVFDFSMGPSMDPYFTVHRVNGDTTDFLGMIQCLDLFIPGDGAIYAAGHVNGMFDCRRRYSIEQQRESSAEQSDVPHAYCLVETPQPFFWVGLETLTTAPLPLFTEESALAASDTLPPGMPITVLLNKGDRYLLRLPFGVTAWTTVDQSYYTPIRHLLYRGD